MSDDDIPREDIDWINHLMRERRIVIQEQGRDSDHFKKIDKDFQSLLKKYGLEEEEDGEAEEVSAETFV